MRKRLDVRGRDRQHRIPQPGQFDPLALSHEPEIIRRSVKRTTSFMRHGQLLDLSAREDPRHNRAVAGLVDQLDDLSALRLNSNDRNDVAGNDAVEPLSISQVLKLHLCSQHDGIDQTGRSRCAPWTRPSRGPSGMRVLRTEHPTLSYSVAQLPLPAGYFDEARLASEPRPCLSSGCLRSLEAEAVGAQTFIDLNCGHERHVDREAPGDE